MDPHDYYRLYPQLRSRSWQRQSAHSRLMDHLIRKANPAQSQICGIDFPPGTVLISSGQYCEQTGEHPQLFAYALRDLQYEGDIAVTLIGHTLIVTLTHYPTPVSEAPEAPPSPQPASFSEPIPKATPEPAAPEETPSSRPASFSEPIPSSSAACAARTTFKIQHSKFKTPPEPGRHPP